MSGLRTSLRAGAWLLLGAMFVSYGFSVAIFALSGVGLYYLAGDPAVWVYVLTVAVATVLTMPLVFRYSRALMLYLFGFVRYNPRWAEPAEQQPRKA
ncbi:DUF983 domain-containing protein [Hymenobacter qilianensis]|uniref:DUF983 domain-containing protein n=1 Tax=Hymenobacter qilianensis TaxID=1385715 RepID=UPI001CB95933|nr:DUF983 domain-containing protein [Hymenobacter qilianensis]